MSRFIDRRAVLTGAASLFAAGLLANCGGGTSAPASSTPGATGPGATTPGAGGKAVLGLSYIPNVQFAPAYLADAKGLLASPAQVSIRHHGANEGLFTALASGQEDFVIAGGAEMMQARSQGQDLVAVAQYYRQFPAVLIVPESSPVKAPADMKGRALGVPGRFGESWFGAQIMLQGAGLTEQDVKINEIGYTPLAALSTGKVDGLIGFSNNDLVQFQLAKVPVRAIPLTTGPVPMVSAVLIATRRTLTERAPLVRQVADAVVAGIEAAVADPEGAVTTSAKYIPNSTAPGYSASATATVQATAKLWTSTDGKVSGKLDPQAWQAMAAFMKEQKLLTGEPEPAKAMSNDFVAK